MSNAEEIYNRINIHEDIQALIGTSESLFLDFKTSSTRDGAMTSDDKRLLKEALCGFTHQEGGVIIWGVNCRENPTNGIDEAIAETPIPNPGNFLKTMNDYYPYTTEPLIDGFQHKLISLNNDPTTNSGFVVCFIPKSYKVHRILDPRKYQFYKRYGTSFRPVETTEEIKSLFFRQTAPVLQVILSPHGTDRGHDLTFQLKLKNISEISAKHISVNIQFIPTTSMQYYDGGGALHWNVWTESLTGDGGRNFFLGNGLILHPQQEMNVFTAQGFFRDAEQRPRQIQYKVYADSMNPLEGVVDL